MIDALLALPSHLRKRLENALHAGLLAPPYQAAAVRAEVGNVAEVEGVVQALRELDASGVSGPGCAALLRCVDRAVSRRPTTDFVWSGPEVPGLHARDTPCQREQIDIGSAPGAGAPVPRRARTAAARARRTSEGPARRRPPVRSLTGWRPPVHQAGYYRCLQPLTRLIAHTASTAATLAFSADATASTMPSR